MTDLRLRAQADSCAPAGPDAWVVAVVVEVAGTMDALREGLALVCGRDDARLDIVLSGRRQTNIRNSFIAAALMSGAASVLPSCTAEAVRIAEAVTLLNAGTAVPWSLWWTADGLAEALIGLTRARPASVAVAAPACRRDRRSLNDLRRSLGTEVLLVDASRPRRA